MSVMDSPLSMKEISLLTTAATVKSCVMDYWSMSNRSHWTTPMEHSAQACPMAKIISCVRQVMAEVEKDC